MDDSTRANKLRKLVIVEDEAITLDGLRRLVPWHMLGFEIAETFTNGEDAEAWLLREPCDVLLTDIVMNKMNGLQLVKNVLAANPGMKVVILSGYNDFTYAQTAIKYGVRDYLTKPVDDGDLMETFNRINQELNEEEQKSKIRLGGETGTEDSLYFSTLGNYMDFVSAIDEKNNEQMQILEQEIIKETENLSDSYAAFFLKNMLTTIASYYQVQRKIDVLHGDEKSFMFNRLFSEITRTQHQEAFKNGIRLICAEIERSQMDESAIVNIIKRYIRENLSLPLRCEDIAKRFHISASYLSRLFKQETGENMNKYIYRKRIEKAAELLTNCDIKIQDIGKMVGYGRHTYFTAQFKKHTGRTPSDYIRYSQ